MEITAEMIHEKYQDLMGARSSNAEHKVLSQAFHASNILIDTGIIMLHPHENSEWNACMQ